MRPGYPGRLIPPGPRKNAAGRSARSLQRKGSWHIRLDPAHPLPISGPDAIDGLLRKDTGMAYS